MSLNLENNIPVSVHNSRSSARGGASRYQKGRVISVELNSPGEVGTIRYTPLFSTDTAPRSAKPLFSAFLQPPVPGELVLILPGPTEEMNDVMSAEGDYYLPPYSVWGSSHHNVFPNLQELTNRIQQNSIPVQDIEAGVTIAPTPVEDPFTIDISEQSDIDTLRLFSGDVLFNGRWGQSLRFSSTTSDKGSNDWSTGTSPGSPVTVLTNETRRQDQQSFSPSQESIDGEEAAIWMLSDQPVRMKDIEENFSLRSFLYQSELKDGDVLKIRTLPRSYETTTSGQQDRMNVK
jgi:hypothetical protein